MPVISDDLDAEMDRLMAEARALEWSHEGQIIHVRMGMERAYERVRESIQAKKLQLA